MDSKISAKEIAEFLNSELFGENLYLSGISTLSNPKKDTIIFSKKSEINIPNDISCLVLVPDDFVCFDDKPFKISYIKVNNPRLALARVLNHFFVIKPKPGISSTAKIAQNAIISNSATLGEGCIIGKNVIIGNNTILNNNVIVHDNCKIGNSCYIKSGAVIGEDGFGFEFDENKIPVRIPHLGSVSIGDNVEIGVYTVIARGTIEDTIIENNVKIDDKVFIAHNCKIGKNTLVTACAEISGSVKIGENCWIAPNSTVINKIEIGDNALIGIGSVVIADIPPNAKYMGLEALELKKLRKYKKDTGYGEKF